MNRDVIIACDFQNKEETMTFLEKFKEEKPYVKIGMELFYGEGPNIVKELKEKGYRIFLDLKLHDIPNTVKKAMKNIARLGVDIVNVHAAGTKAMMSAAIEGLEEGTEEGMKRPLCIAVTQLTSTSEEVMQEELLIDSTLNLTVMKYAKNAKEAGLDGVVCSPLEVPIIKDTCGQDFMTVTPGIRFSDDAKGDQVRVTTPKDANKLGSTFIVVGRSITKAIDPLASYNRCVKDFKEV